MKRNTYVPTAKCCPSNLLKAASLCMFLVFLGAQASAQSGPGVTIKGSVMFTEDNEAAPGVNIYRKGSTAQGTYSDANGRFEFPYLLKAGDVLVFSFIGRKTIEYTVTDLSQTSIEIMMGPENIHMVEQALIEEGHASRSSAFASLWRRAKRNR